MTLEEKMEFHQVFLKKGGYYDFESSPNGVMKLGCKFVLQWIQVAVNECLNDFKDKPIVCIAFINNPRLGAAADKKENNYFIGLYSGSILVLTSIFAKMLCNPDFFPHIGDVTQEVAIKVDNPFLLEGLRISDEFHEHPELYREPNDSMRKEFVTNLVFHAMLFLTLHELGHIVRGHMDFQVFRKRSAAQEDELSSIMPGLSKIESQALEFDADNYAATKGLPLSYLPYAKQPHGSIFQENMLTSWIVSINTLFELHSLLLWEVDKLDLYSHPPAAIRMYMIQGPMWMELEAYRFNLTKLGILLDSPDVLEPGILILSCLAMSSQGFKLITADSQILSAQAESSRLAGEQNEHLEKIGAEWQRLSPELTQFMKY